MTRWHSPPAELYTLVERTPATILLESAAPADSGEGSAESASLTRLFTAPLRVCVANHLAELPNLFAEIERAVSTGLYAAGYFSYECGQFFEPTTAQPISLPRDTQTTQPLAWFGIYRQPYIFDHSTGAFPAGDPPALDQFGATPYTDAPLDCTLSITEQQYAQRIAEIHQLIRAGDVYQLNFTVPIQVRAPGNSAALYRRLRSRQPAPYGAFLHTEPTRRILSFSPELFFRLENQAGTRRITTRPMKGTAPRGRTTREDLERADWLRNDPKNRSENVMIVDLLRNDLGRLCAFGSVRASHLFAVERYPTLWQMTSTITGELRPEVGFQDIFRALFPCGSITGVPKIRAMQLLSQLEAKPRGVYTGAIGFFSPQESVFSVAIRTLSLEGECDGQSGSMGVGSGIVIDSNPADEFRECLLKAEFLTQSAHPLPDSFSLIETMLWHGDYPLIEFHLDRLQDSAHYFAFPFNRAETKGALEAHAAQFSDRQSRKPGAPSFPHLFAERVGNHQPQSSIPAHKVRLLLNPDGSLQITSDPIPASARQPLRVRIAAQRTDPQDPMYFHKTTHRPLYAHAHQAALDAGYDDVLFLNQRGEVTEAAIHNLFIEKDGRLFTPPVACGLLPGVHRRQVLATNSNAQEQTLHLEDLHQADAIYLSNAVRGLRLAVIDWEPV
ncbi:MAG TPA: aminodeoxychorismate synthase component I [Terracidiphilus sp.]|jgi:para-aminobenzoate synthetase/4-amino-4-deoxychorismate lyase